MAPPTARREVFALFAAGFAAEAATIVGSAVDVRYQGVEEPMSPGALEYFVRASTQLADTGQSGFVVAEHAAKGVRFTTDGVAIFQVFAPMKSPGAYAKGELLASLVQRIFMSAETPSGVWFRRPRINELENDGTWYRWNVLTDFQFDQAKGN